MLPAKLVRVAKWVRLGPILPSDTPSTVWQPPQPFWANRREPASPLVPADALTEGARWLATQASKSAGVMAMALARMLAWEAPQNSVHWPMYSPGLSAENDMWLLRPGTTSVFPARGAI